MRMLSLHLTTYAENHAGRYLATLEDKDFTVKLDPGDREFIRSVQVDYTQPAAQGTNVVRRAVAHSRWETLALYSDGTVERVP